jgi:hypothetical protein
MSFIKYLEEKMKVLKEEKEVVDYEIIDHGIESEQYFQGCGVSYTKFSDCFTGIGESAKEALEDALEQAAESDWNVEGIENKLSEEEIEREDDSEDDERHYYVSIRVK